jgi:hypothetical protein
MIVLPLICTVQESLLQTLRFPSLLRLHQSLPGNEFQQCPLRPFSLCYRLATVSHLTYDGNQLCLQLLRSVGQIAVGFASTAIPGFSLLEIHDQDYCSLLEGWRGRSFYADAAFVAP